MEALFSNPAIVALIAGIPSLLLAWFGYRKSMITDKRAETANAASFQISSVDQIISGLNTLIDNLQDDNKLLRSVIIELTNELKDIKSKGL